MDAADLAQLSFFEGFDTATLEKVAATGEVVEAEAGAVITEQGAVGQEAYVVVAGDVQVIVSGQEVATVGPGSVLGEMALLDLRPRSATLKAATAVELLCFDSKRFREIIDEMPMDARARLAEQNARFRSANQAITDADRPRRIGG